MHQEALVTVEFAEDELIITPRGIWKLWSLCRELRIPYQAITAVRQSSNPTNELQPRWRCPGLGTVGSLAGYTRGPKGRGWWCYKYGADAVSLSLDLAKLKNVTFIAANTDEVVRSIDAHRNSRV